MPDPLYVEGKKGRVVPDPASLIYVLGASSMVTPTADHPPPLARLIMWTGKWDITTILKELMALGSKPVPGTYRRNGNPAVPRYK